jgi:hypothetical protein
MVLTIRQLRTFIHSPKQLKAACGSGGTAKDGDYEAQGDHVATVMVTLVTLGYAAIDNVQVGQTRSYRGLLGNSGRCTTTRISTEVIAVYFCYQTS